VTPTEIIIWWAASIALIAAGIFTALVAHRRYVYNASVIVAAVGGAGMLFTLRVLMITSGS